VDSIRPCREYDDGIMITNPSPPRQLDKAASPFHRDCRCKSQQQCHGCFFDDMRLKRTDCCDDNDNQPSTTQRRIGNVW
jgi:hypothetical protein